MYEVIRYGHRCHLYFDLEYSRPANPWLNGNDAVDALLALVAAGLRCAPAARRPPLRRSSRRPPRCPAFSPRPSSPQPPR